MTGADTYRLFCITNDNFEDSTHHVVVYFVGTEVDVQHKSFSHLKQKILSGKV